MHTVDTDFKMSYDLRNDQEAEVTAKRNARIKRATHAHETPADDACPMFGSNGIKVMCLAGLALLGFGVGLQLGIDQYNKS